MMNITEQGELDIMAMVKTIWNLRKKIIIIILVFLFLGIFVAIFSPKEYTASSTFVPQVSEPSRQGSSLGGLASLAGINLGSSISGSEIPPLLYPKITSSVTFKKGMLDAKLNIEGLTEEVTYRNYYENIYDPGILGKIKKYTVGLPGEILGLIRNENQQLTSETESEILKVSKAEFEHFQRLSTQFSIVPNEKEGFVTISFSLPEPTMSAQMVKFTQDLLQKELIAFKISNAKEQLKYTEERYEEKKKEFDMIQIKLANFRDRNQNISSATAMNQLERLEGEYNFAFNIYIEMAKQLEQAKLQVSKDTPVFSVIQPVSVPTEKSGPKRFIILIVYTFLGILVALGYVVVTVLISGLKNRW